MLVRWRRTEDGEWPYYAEVDGHVLRVRVNDFPAEPLYSLVRRRRADRGSRGLADGVGQAARDSRTLNPLADASLSVG